MSEETPQFIGEYEDVPVDPKGRLIVPSACRKALPMGVTTFVIAQWFDGCLAGFDPKGWQRVLGKLQTLDGGQKTVPAIDPFGGRGGRRGQDRPGRDGC